MLLGGLGKAGREWGRLGRTLEGWEGLWKAGRDCGRLKMLREGRGKAVRDRGRPRMLIGGLGRYSQKFLDFS